MDEYQKQIDSLLERYLAFLDEYTQLREKLSKLQSGIYQNIARANFSAERGLRYGQDQYDERMQASRVLRHISAGDDEDQSEVPGFFRVVDPESLSSSPKDEDEEAREPPQDEEEDKEKVEEEEEEEEEEEKEPSRDEGENEKSGASEEKAKTKDEEEKAQPPKRKDPLFWFGVLAPAPLRNAQASSVEAVEQVIPRLVAVDAQMSHLEIEVRRARKKRAKALEKEKKEKERTDDSAAMTEEVEARIATMTVEAT